MTTKLEELIEQLQYAQTCIKKRNSIIGILTFIFACIAFDDFQSSEILLYDGDSHLTLKFWTFWGLKQEKHHLFHVDVEGHGHKIWCYKDHDGRWVSAFSHDD